MSFTQTVVNVKQADGTTVPMIAYTDGTNTVFAHALLDATGAVISPATSGLQTTGNSTLATIATNTNGVSTAARQDTTNVILAATATSTDNLDDNLGAKGDAAVTNPASSASAISALKGALTLLAAATPAGANIIGKVGIDQTTPGTTNLVQLPGPRIYTSTTLTRPNDATAYTAGDLVANSTTAGSVASGTLDISDVNDMLALMVGLTLEKSQLTFANAIFRAHFFSAAPTVSAGDNSALTPQFANYLGAWDFPNMAVGSDVAIGEGRPVTGMPTVCKPATGTTKVRWLLEARAAYACTNNETFVLKGRFS